MKAPQKQEAPEQNPDVAGRRKGRRILIACSAVLGLATAGAAVWRGMDGRNLMDSATVAVEDQARAALAAFLKADNPAAKVRWVLSGESVLPQVEAYYAGRESEVYDPAAFQQVEAPAGLGARGVVVFELPRGRGLTPVVACMSRNASGQWCVDWDLWRQSAEGQFRDFVARPAEGEHTLRLKMTNQGAIEGGFKVSVEDPFDAAPPMVFDVTRPDLAAVFSRDLPPGSVKIATLQLVWLNDGLTGTLQSQIRRHVCWGFHGLDGVEAGEIPHPRAGKYRIFPEQDALTESLDEAVGAALLTTSGTVPEKAMPAAEPPAVAAKP